MSAQRPEEIHGLVPLGAAERAGALLHQADARGTGECAGREQAESMSDTEKVDPNHALRCFLLLRSSVAGVLPRDGRDAPRPEAAEHPRVADRAPEDRRLRPCAALHVERPAAHH